MRRNFESGQRCGDNHDVIDGKPSGAIRISFGAMSSLLDVNKFIDFMEEFYVEKRTQSTEAQKSSTESQLIMYGGFFIESLSIFPIKSCAAYRIPIDVRWLVKEAGLAFDREWCLVHQGTGSALSQKRYPRMALLQPSIDLREKLLRVSFLSDIGTSRQIAISLDKDGKETNCANMCDSVTDRTSNVCGDNVEVQVYNSLEVSEFFTEALDVPCTLARCPVSTTNRIGRPRRPGQRLRASASGALAAKVGQEVGKSILLSNESPILLISRSSVNRLNECIKAAGSVGRAVSADSFRGNIVVAEEVPPGTSESPYIEEVWQSLEVGNAENTFEVMGPCQRCQMVCVDQKSAQKRQEPFTTLAKTRRKDGKVWFGMHLCLAPGLTGDDGVRKRRWIKVGDPVVPR